MLLQFGKNLFWASERGQFLYGLESLWLSGSLLQADGQERLGDALIAAARHWPVELHFQKGHRGWSDSRCVW